MTYKQIRLWYTADLVVAEQAPQLFNKTTKQVLFVPAQLWGFVYVTPMDVDMATVPADVAWLIYKPASMLLTMNDVESVAYYRMTSTQAQDWYRSFSDGNVKRMRLRAVKPSLGA
jgi:hypothetical protein